MKKQVLAFALALMMLVAFIVCQALPTFAAELIPGDLNGDGELTSDDAIYLLKSVFSRESFPIPEGMDMDNNSDGEITSDDAIYLLKAVFSRDSFPLKPIKSTDPTTEATTEATTAPTTAPTTEPTTPPTVDDVVIEIPIPDAEDIN